MMPRGDSNPLMLAFWFKNPVILSIEPEVNAITPICLLLRENGTKANPTSICFQYKLSFKKASSHSCVELNIAFFLVREDNGAAIHSNLGPIIGLEWLDTLLGNHVT